MHELWVRAVVEVDGTERGTCVGVLANPAHDILELDTGALVPVIFVTSCVDGVTTIDPPDGLFDLDSTDAAGRSYRCVGRRLHHLSPAGRRLLQREPARQGRANGLLDLRLPRPARAHHRRPPHRRRHAVRRWRRHGDAAGTDLRRGRGRRPAAAAVPARPGRRRFDQRAGRRTRRPATGFSLLCGRYEGIDHRVREHLVDDELSASATSCCRGGEVAACLVIEAVTRLLPGAMGNSVSPVTESFGAAGLLEEPQYTRPAEFRGWDGARRCCAAATTPASSAGAAPRPCTARCGTGPTWSRPAAGCQIMTGGCWKSSPPSPILEPFPFPQVLAQDVRKTAP